uniref:Uncharacterized protein n=1 Tax=Arundo donax TaxID=35708 RepID=A0A0A8YTG6_ARUDO
MDIITISRAFLYDYIETSLHMIRHCISAYLMLCIFLLVCFPL